MGVVAVVDVAAAAVVVVFVVRAGGAGVSGLLTLRYNTEQKRGAGGYRENKHITFFQSPSRGLESDAPA